MQSKAMSISPPASLLLREAFAEESSLLHCLEPLLVALGWQGSVRRLFEVMPHLYQSLDLSSFCQIMESLDFSSHSISVSLHEIASPFTPCLFVPKNDDSPVLVILEKNEEGLKVFNAETKTIETVLPENILGTMHIFQKKQKDEQGFLQKKWFGLPIVDLDGMLGQLFVLSFMLNILSVAAPLFIMAVYDQVIIGDATEVLSGLLIGMGIAVVASWVLQLLRGRVLSYASERLHKNLGRAVFNRLLNLPISQTGQVALGLQIARIKDFDNIKEFFSGPSLGLLFELPFTVIFLFVIGLLAGDLVLVPLAFIGITGLSLSLLQSWLHKKSSVDAKALSARQNFLLESLENMRTLQELSATKSWGHRYRELSARAAQSSFQANLANMLVRVGVEASVLIAGSVLLALGTLRVMSNEMSLGALIAVMILLWRVLGPFRLFFIAMPRLSQVKQGMEQISRLLMMKTERDDHVCETCTTFSGHVRLSRIGMRYHPSADPAIAGVNFQAKPGELVAIVGPSRAGKSTLLKVIAGIYPTQVGSVYFDGQDSRQLDPLELRQSVSYLPQATHIFYGSVSQNIRLANPLADAAAVETAARQAGLWELVSLLPEGMETVLKDKDCLQLSSGFKQKLALARAYLRNSPILLLDEPATTLDDEGDRYFTKMLENLRGKTTVIMATHRPSHVRLADRILVLRDGQVILQGSPDIVLPKLKGGEHGQS